MLVTIGVGCDDFPPAVTHLVNGETSREPFPSTHSIYLRESKQRVREKEYRRVGLMCVGRTRLVRGAYRGDVRGAHMGMCVQRTSAILSARASVRT
jgi:hypothetical protein